MNKKRFTPVTAILLLMAGTVFMSGCNKDDDGGENCNGSSSTVADADGNTYKTVTIGTQTWFAENLKTTTYNDGTSIPNVTDGDTWAILNTAAQCTYKNTTNADTIARYGRLYNWYAVAKASVSNGSKNICPKGWHVPSDAEWDTLKTYLTNNGYGYSGSIAKSLADTTGWKTSSDEGDIGNNPSTNNSSGFSAMPGGYRSYAGGDFGNFGNNCDWWCSAENNSYDAYLRSLSYDYGTLQRHYNYGKNYGFSVRCIKD